MLEPRTEGSLYVYNGGCGVVNAWAGIDTGTSSSLIDSWRRKYNVPWINMHYTIDRAGQTERKNTHRLLRIFL